MKVSSRISASLKYLFFIIAALIVFLKSAFALPPAEPHHPFPADGATGVQRTVILDWLSGDPDENDNVTYDVYFGSTPNPPLVLDDWPGCYYYPFEELGSSLNANSTYYWKIVADDNAGNVVEGQEWSFATASPPSIDMERWNRSIFFEDDHQAAFIDPFDMDGDTDIDLLTCGQAEHSLTWFENIGNDEFIEHLVDTDDDAYFLRSCQAVDLDGDDDIDIVGYAYSEIYWWENIGNNQYSRRNVGEHLDYLREYKIFDLDNDNDIDLCTIGFNSLIFWENDGSQNFSQNILSTNFPDGYEIDIGDIDADGDYDIVTSSNNWNNNFIAWWENDSAGSFTRNDIEIEFDDIVDIRIADINMDGSLDILCGLENSPSLMLLEYQEDGSFLSQNLSSSHTGFCTFEIDDIDNDGDNDIVGRDRNSSSLVFYFNQGNNDFLFRQVFNDFQTTRDFKIADLDGDGNRDIIESRFETDPSVICWSFTENVAPEEPLCIYPENEAVNVERRIDFEWSCSDPENDIINYTIRLSEINPPLDEVANSQSQLSWHSPTSLNLETTYYWQIVAVDEYQDSSFSQVNSFTTTSSNLGPDPAIAVYPYDGTQGIPRNLELQWLCNDGDMDDMTFDLFLGTVNNPPLLQSGININRYNPLITLDQPLEANTTYYWRIDATDEYGSITQGEVWSFTTVSETFVNRWNFHGVLPAHSSYHYDMIPADLDNDGDMDIISNVNFGGNRFQWLENDGNQNFTGHTIYDNYRLLCFDMIDFDIDGDSDIILGAGYQSLLIWIENNGEGDFVEHQIEIDNLRYETLKVADIDLDGDYDIIIRSEYQNKLKILLNDGSFQFTTVIVDDSAPDMNSIYTVDYNNDGFLDIITDSREWYENDGSLNFSKHNIFDPDQNISNLQIKDFNFDGQVDIIGFNPENESLSWWQNEGDMILNEIVIDPSISSLDGLKVVDFNGDGYFDLAGISVSRDEIYLWLNDGLNNFSRILVSEDFRLHYYFNIADLDSDGDMDFINGLLDRNYSLGWFESEINQSPNEIVNISPETGATNIVRRPILSWSTTDPEEDDIVYTLKFSTSNPPEEIIYNEENYTSWAPMDPLETGTTYYWQVTAEDEWDGITESEVWSFTTTSIDLTLGGMNLLSPDNGAENVSRTAELDWICGDLDGDEVNYTIYFGTDPNPPEVITNWPGSYFNPYHVLDAPLEANTTYYWKIRAQDDFGSTLISQTWSFTTCSELPEIDYWHQNNISETNSLINSVEVADIDNDGLKDFLVSQRDAVPSIYWLHQNQNHTFSLLSIDNTQYNRAKICAFDLDNDGDTDILGLTESPQPQFAWWENDGNESFSNSLIGYVGNNWSRVDFQIDDIDDDGDNDIVMASSGNYQISIWENDGLQNFCKYIIYDFPHIYPTISLADLDNDGDKDIVSANANTSGRLLWWENQGNRVFISRVVDSVIYRATTVKTADMNNDGRIDIIAGSAYNDYLYMWLNDEFNNFTPYSIAAPINRFLDFSIGDINGDAMTDVVLFNGTAQSSSVQFYENLDGSTFNLMVIEDEFPTPLYAHIDDIDNNGIMDISGLSVVNNDLVYFTPDSYRSPEYFELASPHNDASINADEVTVEWTEATDPQGLNVEYEVQWTLDENFSTYSTATVTELTYTISDIQQLLAQNNNGDNPADNLQPNNSFVLKKKVFKTEKSNVSAKSNSALSRKTDLRYSNTQQFQQNLNNSSRLVVDKGNRSVSTDELPDDNTIFWRVKATNLTGLWRWANDDESGHFFHVDIYDSPEPFALISPTENDTCWTLDTTLVWHGSTDADIDAVPFYDVWMDTLQDFSTAWMVADSTGDTTLEVTDLLDEKVFYWSVRATDDNTSGTWATETFSFSTYLPESPQIFALAEPADASTVNSDTVTVSWFDANDPDANDLTKYDIEWSLFPDFSTSFFVSTEDTFFVITDLANLPGSLTQNSPSTPSNGQQTLKFDKNQTVGLDELPDDDTIYWRVKASDNWGFEVWCEAGQTGWSFTIDEYQSPSPFTLISPVDEDTSWDLNATLSWNSSGDPDPYDNPAYDVWLDIQADFSTAIQVADSISDISFDLTELEDDTRYFWRVRATDSNTAGTWSTDTLSFYTYLPESPESFDLLEPRDGAVIEEIEGNPIVFKWMAAIDPDPNDQLLYSLEIAEDYELTSPIIISNIETDSLVFEGLPIDEYWWRVKVSDLYGFEVYSSQSWSLNVTLGIEQKFDGIPSVYEISSIYPNPFNPSMTAIISLPDPGELTVGIYNVMGRQIATIANGKFQPGYHSFTYDGSTLASGVYFVRATVPGKLNQLQKVVLMK